MCAYVCMYVYFKHMREIRNNEHILLTLEISAIKSDHILPKKSSSTP